MKYYKIRRRFSLFNMGIYRLTCDVSTDNTQLIAPVRTGRLYIGRGPGQARYSSPARLHKLMLGQDVRPGLQMRQTRHGRLQQVSPDVTYFATFFFQFLCLKRITIINEKGYSPMFGNSLLITADLKLDRMEHE